MSTARGKSKSPPGAGWKRPLERYARPGAVAWPHNTLEAAEHDKWVSIFEREELEQMLDDLRCRVTRWSNAPENRWAGERCAAIRRRLEFLNKTNP